MKNNRRDFIKLAGATGLGIMGACSLKNSNTAESPKSDSELGHIKTESGKSYTQLFNMSGYAAPAIETVRVGIVGLGNRGVGAVSRLSYIEGVEIKGLCDLLEERAEAAKSKIKTPGHNPNIYFGAEDAWMKMCQREDIDLIYIATPWPLHAPMAIYAMENGKHAATEIPAATTVEDCWKLVQTSEKTKKHCVILENCCYDFFELLTLNLARQGFFGEIIHGEGAYIHEIGESLFHRGNPNERWRLKQNIARNGNLYPTHGLGPIAQVMKVNRGNRMDYLVSTSTKDFMMNGYAKELAKSDDYYKQFVNTTYRGNMNTSVIKTVAGQTIMLQHDVTTLRPYSRLHLISGTEATAQKYPLPGRIAVGDNDWMGPDELKKLEEEYNPPIIKMMREMALKIGGHGGMDFLMDWRMIDCLRNGLPVDMDVYDAASWSVIGPLSEWSVANRSMPIDIPDFTLGKWKTNTPHDIALSKGGTTKVRPIQS
jgi:hypothetical protein